jgi:hypothetical protein
VLKKFEPTTSAPARIRFRTAQYTAESGVTQFSSSSVFAAIEANQNQGRKPYDRDEEYVQDGFGRSLTERCRRGVVPASGFLISFFGSMTLLSAISRVGSATASSARGSTAVGGTHGKSA